MVHEVVRLEKTAIKETVVCPCCQNSMSKDSITDVYHVVHTQKENVFYDYYKCTECGSIFISPDVIYTLDGGGTSTL